MQKRIRILGLIALDILIIYLAYYVAFWLRFDGNFESRQVIPYWTILKDSLPLVLLVKIGTFAYFRLYKSLWEYASVEELLNIITGVIVGNLLVIAYYLMTKGMWMPRSIYIITPMVELLLIGGVRFLYRGLRRIKRGTISEGRRKARRVLIIGAGDAGAVIVKELKHHTDLNSIPVAILDDNQRKHGSRLNGVPIVGDTTLIDKVTKDLKIDEIIIAIPSASKGCIKNIVNECKGTKAKIKILPGVYELIDGKVKIAQVREVRLEDLLGRDPVSLDTKFIEDYIKDKVVMVTGGGGSIGSELCRQIARFNPSLLIILDISENSVYALEHELNTLYNPIGSNVTLNLKVLIASVRDKARIDKLFDELRPHTVFHAAAHKHVPLMEDNAPEAIKNNIFGTYHVADAADKYNTKKFILVSTDKAVNPTNVMGASKRYCEKIIQAYSKISKTTYALVRFGNVLGSNGSVIPLFKSQIEAGGPITLTHRDITRYFMTIPEASQLVLQAGSMAKGGEIFILDMGEPVRIFDLAKDLIRLSGLSEEDIEIVETGLRPGEKLYEELLMDDEAIEHTSHKKIVIGQASEATLEEVKEGLEHLRLAANTEDNETVKEALSKLVPSYTRRR